MSTALRFRIIALQAILVLVLCFAAGFAFYESSFVNGYIHDQLADQQISFPAASEIKAGGALDPAEFPESIRQYAGTQVDSGPKAYQYANNFIGKHLESVGKDPVSGQVVMGSNGKPLTYATMGDYITQQKAAGASAATITTLNSERDTMFKGEMLRGTLLNVWGWSQVALYTWYAAIGLTIAAIAVFAALVFEVVLAVRAIQQGREVAVGKAAGVTA